MKKLLLAAIMAALVAITSSVFSSEPLGTRHVTTEVQVTGQKLVGVVAEGLRLDLVSSGVVTDGFLTGATFEGVDYALIRHDGVMVIYAHYFCVTVDGATIAMVLRGYLGEPTPGLFEAMLDPEFEPPDVDIPVHGAAWFETMAPQYAFLNHAVFAMSGTVNRATGAIRSTFRPIAE
jgi:hypothetical protein